MFKTVISVRDWIVNAFLEVQSGLGKRRKVQLQTLYFFADGFSLSPLPIIQDYCLDSLSGDLF